MLARALRSRWMSLLLSRLIGRVDHFRRRRAVEAELNGLEERTLHDIGISNSDIPSIASQTYFRDETRRQRDVPTHACSEAQGLFSSTVSDTYQRTTGGIAMTSPVSRQPREFAERWIEAWNRHDLDAVLAHFSKDLEFCSPLIPAFAGDPSGRLIGKEAVRRYWNTGLSRLPDLHFELVDVLVGVGCLLILYRGHRGLSAEVLTLGTDGRATRGQAFHAAES